MVEFHTNLRGHDLKWCMNIINLGVLGIQGQAFTLGQLWTRFIEEFKLPQSEQQAISELREIHQREGESAWEYNQKFKYGIGRLAHPINEEHQREWYIQGLLPLTQILLMQQQIATLKNALEQSMKIEAMEGYLESLRVTKPLVDMNLAQLQGKISVLTKKIQELTIPGP
jgi:hypothetical protein